MRIFLSLEPSGNASVPNSKTWLHNLYEPLLDLGHEVYLARIDEAAKLLNVKCGTNLFKEKFSEYILQTFKKEHHKKQFDFFLSYFRDDHIDLLLIDEIKKLGVPTANFSCNNTHQFYLTKNIATHYDFNLHSEK
jgi:spore maturation protein CgeB